MADLRSSASTHRSGLGVGPGTKYEVPTASVGAALVHPPHLDHQPLPAFGIRRADARDGGGIAGAVHHARGHPGVDVGREMADDVAAGRVHPHARLIHTGWIGNEDEAVAFLEATDDG